MQPFHLRFGWPVAIVSLCFAGLCAFTAVSLFSQQASLSAVLRENAASQRAATEMEECLLDLLALLKGRVEDVAPLHERLRTHLDLIHRQADQPEELAMAAGLEEALARYHARRAAMPPAGKAGHAEAVHELVQAIERDLLKPTQDFGNFNARRIDDSTGQHQAVLQRLAWGMAGVGGLGAVAGVFLGYGISRGMHGAIHRLAVQIRAAAGIMGEEPRVVLTEEGNFQGLHDLMGRLQTRIEAVVQSLHEREREVLRAEQLAAVGQLAAGVAHEIRNPLTSILMLAQAGLEEGALPGDDLRVIEREVRRMERSLQAFLDFARPPRPERRPTSLRGLLEDTRGLIQGRAARQGVTIHLDLPPDDVVLVADAQLLEQVLVNLALNALDAMPQGGGLTLSLLDEGASVVLTAADTGPGITPEVAGRLFQPFVSSKPAGVGLGLVISRRIVEDHGGTIAASARPGGGAVFTVRLPRPGTREAAECPPS